MLSSFSRRLLMDGLLCRSFTVGQKLRCRYRRYPAPPSICLSDSVSDMRTLRPASSYQRKASVSLISTKICAQSDGTKDPGVPRSAYCLFGGEVPAHGEAVKQDTCASQGWATYRMQRPHNLPSRTHGGLCTYLEPYYCAIKLSQQRRRERMGPWLQRYVSSALGGLLLLDEELGVEVRRSLLLAGNSLSRRLAHILDAHDVPRYDRGVDTRGDGGIMLSTVMHRPVRSMYRGDGRCLYQYAMPEWMYLKRRHHFYQKWADQTLCR